jgi:FKBP-type peptidyl-prolyl cis-trans isomerase
VSVASVFAGRSGQRAAWRRRRRVKSRSSSSASSSGTSASIREEESVPLSSPAAFPGTVDESVWVELLRPGDGVTRPADGDEVQVHYACLLARDGCLVDTSRSARDRKLFTIILGGKVCVDGLDRGLRSLTLGALARVHCPASLGYGAVGNGVVPPDAALVFEVEVRRVRRRKAPPIPVGLLRKLLMLPAQPPPTAHESRASIEGELAVLSVIASEALQAAEVAEVAEVAEAAEALEAADAAERAGGAAPVPAHGGDGFESEPDSPRGKVAARRGAEGGIGYFAWWLARLRCTQPLPLPECRSFFRMMAQHSRAELVSLLCDSARGGQRILPGTLPLRRAPHGSSHDGRSPLICTGERPGWPCFSWGWTFWGVGYGDTLVSAKQRAPIYASDRGSLAAEVSLAEFVRYARATGAQAVEEQACEPVLYMNGWALFDTKPALWDWSIAEIPGTIDNLTAVESRRAHAQMRLGTEPEDIAPRVRQFCKLFVGPRGATTRMHQDNFRAHAWLSQIRGRKLYVLCSPADTKLIRATFGRADESAGVSGSATCDCGAHADFDEFDPLQPEVRARCKAAGIRLYAVVLQPGETLVNPEGWWHYAVSLTPSITLMCNYWDNRNLGGLHECFGVV